MKRYKKLDWDTDFFKVPIGRIEASTLTDAEASAVVEEAKRDGIECLYFLADGGSPQTWSAAVRHGFVPVDVKINFDQLLINPPAKVDGIRMAIDSDRPMLLEITKSMFSGSRFYADPHFAREDCDALYRRWLSNALSNPAAGTLVAEEGGEISGYITCENNRIGLIGVRPEGRGRGIAGRLVAASLSWFFDCGVRSVEVATQGNNLAAQRIYQKHGFRTRTLELWFHWWRSP